MANGIGSGPIEDAEPIPLPFSTSPPKKQTPIPKNYKKENPKTQQNNPPPPIYCKTINLTT